MKNFDKKMRERFEQREYFGDSHGLTRVEKMHQKKLDKEIRNAKRKALKRLEDE